MAYDEALKKLTIEQQVDIAPLVSGISIDSYDITMLQDSVHYEDPTMMIKQ
jgi:hypothetical protein